MFYILKRVQDGVTSYFTGKGTRWAKRPRVYRTKGALALSIGSTQFARWYGDKILGLPEPLYPTKRPLTSTEIDKYRSEYRAWQDQVFAGSRNYIHEHGWESLLPDGCEIIEVNLEIL